AFVDGNGFGALDAGEDGFQEDGPDPWDDQTLGMPDEMPPSAAADDDSSMSGPDLERTSSAINAVSRSVDHSAAPLVDDASDLSKEILAAAEASAREHDGVGWFEEGADALDEDDPWGDQTAADPGLFDNDGDAVHVHELDNEEPLDLGLDDVSLHSLKLEEDILRPDLEPTASPHDMVDPTVAQDPPLDDATIDQSALKHALDDATIDQAAAQRALSNVLQPGLENEEATPLRTHFDDDRTVGYNEEFSVRRRSSLAMADSQANDFIGNAALDDVPTAGLDEVAHRLNGGSLNDVSTVQHMAEEPALPVMPVPHGEADLDDRTVAGVVSDRLPSETGEATLNPAQQPTGDVPLARIATRAVPESRVASWAGGTPRADLPSRVGRDGLPTPRPKRASSAVLRNALKSDSALHSIQESPPDDPDATVGDIEMSLAGEPVDAPLLDNAFLLEHDRNAEPVRPVPMDAPPGEEDQISYQDEYSALVVQPEPL
ncbi:MAG: hypothetical protein AAGK78_10055, partial [Planctomycetota bacterium]